MTETLEELFPAAAETVVEGGTTATGQLWKVQRSQG